MSFNTLNTGNDLRVDVMGPNGYITLDTITQFVAQQMTNELEAMPLGQDPIFGEVPKGWSGSFHVQRKDGRVDDFFALMEANYWAGINVPSGLITETISNPDGSINQYRFTKVVFKFPSIGDRKQDAFIDMEIGFRAARRVKVS